MSFKRLAPSAILAVGVTTVITLGMAGMIKTEFTPQDKVENLGFEINPEVEEPPVIKRTDRVLEVKRVETPPPPPEIERTPTAQPTVSIVNLDSPIPDFDMPEIDQENFVITISDREVQPLVRISPIMPPRAERSGHCKVRFNVSAEGAPYDVTATYCTQSLFERATVKSVQRWKFNPKIVNGRPVAMTGVENRVTYRLKDERGNLIPE
ncbi:MAG: energy transducer TonB [Hellea sp.]